MKLIIDIPEEVKQTFDNAKNEDLYGNYYDRNSLIGKAIQNGIPLPKGHGRIVDIGKIDEDRIDDDNPIIYLTINGEYIEAVSLDYLNNLSTIIEADKAESEDKE